MPKIVDRWRMMGFAGLQIAQQSWLTDPIDTSWLLMNLIAPNLRDAPEAHQNAFLVQGMLASRWAVSGFPVVNMTHRLAATLMATSITADVIEDVRLPWHAVFVRLPSQLLFIDSAERGPVEAVTFGFTSYDHEIGGQRKRCWSYVVSTEEEIKRESGMDAFSIWAFHVPQEHLLSPELPHQWDTINRTSTDDRTEILCRRLMVGLCLWCSDPKNLGQPKTVHHGLGHKNRDGSMLPPFKSWFLGRDIELDDRVIGAVRAYAREGGSSPKVQSLVSGHWKRQQHGPNRSLRKLIHVAPYWRGPLDAPVLDKSGSR
jgi:hypothetical protein